MHSHEVTEQLYYNFHNAHCIYSHISFYIPIIICLCYFSSILPDICLPFQRTVFWFICLSDLYWIWLLFIKPFLRGRVGTYFVILCLTLETQLINFSLSYFQIGRLRGHTFPSICHFYWIPQVLKCNITIIQF